MQITARHHEHEHEKNHKHESAADDRRPGRASRSRAGWVARGAVSATPVRLQCVERRVANGACPVCTCDEVHFDEVEFGRSMRLAECPRCEHRWTTPVATTRLAPARRRMVAVPASSVDAAAQA